VLNEFWTIVLAVSLLVYLVLMLGLGLWSARQAGDSAEEYLLAGRSLSVPMATITLLATWFGAGTMLTVTNEVAAEGLSAAALDPVGVALCLILAGWILAAPLWKMGLLTVCDFYARRFGWATEKVAALILIPSYFGWIAVQFVAVARLLELFFGLDTTLGLVLVMLAGTTYTMLGGMRAVVLTDVFQLSLVLLGLVLLVVLMVVDVGTGQVYAAMGNAWDEPGKLSEAMLLLDLLVVGCLGNLPAQDLVQRFLSTRTAQGASRACYWAGGCYLLFGTFPILMGVVAASHSPGETSDVVMDFAKRLMTGPVMVVFVLAVISAVLSTIDGAILSPAGVMAQNLIPRSVSQRWGTVNINRACVALIAVMSLATALSGKTAYGLLEDAYSLMLVGLLVPLLGGLWLPRRPPVAALTSMLVGTGLWLPHLFLDEEYKRWFAQPWLEPWGVFLPTNLTITLIAAVVFLLVGRDREVEVSGNGRIQGTAEP